jgi:Phosphotransferase enzyme family
MDAFSRFVTRKDLKVNTMTEKETLLSGGNVNTEVVRVGNTVRRNLTNASATIHQLLLHLEAKKFKGSPRFLGIDEKKREMLSFLDGDTGIPSYIWQEDQALVASAQLLRQYHDATLDFLPSKPTWAYIYPNAQHHEVICHNDFAPYNFIYASQVPIAVIDFDLAGPGPRLRDVAYASYWMTPLSFNSNHQRNFAETDSKNGSRRLKLFCKTYGVNPNAELLDMITEVLTFMGDEQQMQSVLGESVTAKLKKEGHLDHWQREQVSFQNYRARIITNLLEL